MEQNRLSESCLAGLKDLPPLEKYRLFRETYPEFLYEGYALERSGQSLTVAYRFRVPGLAAFAPRWTLPLPEGAALEDGAVKRLVWRWPF